MTARTVAAMAWVDSTAAGWLLLGIALVVVGVGLAIPDVRRRWFASQTRSSA